MTLVISRYQHNRDPQPDPTVTQVQKHLIRRGFDVGPYGADGRYGTLTERAVVRFQTHRGLKADGQVGLRTWDALSLAFPKADPTRTDGKTQAQRAAEILYYRVTGKDGHPAPHYVFGYEIANLATRYPAAMDCSEAVQWAVFQVTKDDWVDGSYAQHEAGDRVTLDYARNHEGVLVFLTSNGAVSGIHHVGMTKLVGKRMGVAQARSAYLSPQCGWWPFSEQPWAFAVKVPILYG